MTPLGTRPHAGNASADQLVVNPGRISVSPIRRLTSKGHCTYRAITAAGAAYVSASASRTIRVS